MPWRLISKTIGSFRHPGRFAWNTAVGVALVVAANDYLFEVQPITGQSMSPTLSPDFHTTGSKDWILFSKWKPWKNVERGQLVSYWTPHDPEKISVKRVIAVAGDTVVPKDRAPGQQRFPFARVTVPHGHIWIEGDNWRNSKDSNDFGAISLGLVTGKAAYIIKPWERIGRVGSDKFKSRSTVIKGGGVGGFPAGWDG